MNGRTITFGDDIAADLESSSPPIRKTCPRTGIAISAWTGRSVRSVRARPVMSARPAEQGCRLPIRSSGVNACCVGDFSALLLKSLGDHGQMSYLIWFRSETFRLPERFPQIWRLNCRKVSGQRKVSDKNRT